MLAEILLCTLALCVVAIVCAGIFAGLDTGGEMDDDTGESEPEMEGDTDV